jgi:uncharacterized repeat protein (TIGR01451 family)
MRKALAAAAALAMTVVLAIPAGATVTPPTADVTVAAGGSGTSAATVQVPALPAKADIEIAIDTTGTMGPTIDQAKAEATAMVAAVQAQVPDAQFAVVDFKDFIDGPDEYVLRQPMTASAANVSTAIGAMTAAGGGDTPEAYNRVFQRAYEDPVGGPAMGWRTDSRKFVVVIGDAGPHAADEALYPDCFVPFDADPDNLVTKDELGALAAHERTLLMVAAGDTGIIDCYNELVAGGFSGSAASSLGVGASIADRILALIEFATSQVSTVDLAVATTPTGADASWLSFATEVALPASTPADVPFQITVKVPPGTPPGAYPFVLAGHADGLDVGQMTLTVTVPDTGGGEATIAKTVDQPSVARGDTVTYTITVHNGTADDVVVRRVVDLLPRKFRFRSGSSQGGGRPKVRHSHRQVTWRPRATVPAGADLVITFSARVRLRDGCGLNRASARLGDGSTIRTGPTAQVCVTGDDEDHHHHHGGGDDDASGGHGHG